MDIVTHAITGAITGATFGHPIAGAIAAVLPDAPLGIKRKPLPTTLYDMAHAPLVMALPVAWLPYAATGDLSLAAAVFLAYLSHVVLDLQTHGDAWAPYLFAPLAYRRISLGDEWEWFNRSWWLGMLTAVIWSLACLTLFAS